MHSVSQLYCEVRAKREGTGSNFRRHEEYDNDLAQRLSVHSRSTSSSLLSEASRSEQLSSSSRSEALGPSPLPCFGHQGSTGSPSNYTNVGSQRFQHEPTVQTKSRGSFDGDKRSVDTSELDAFCPEAFGRGGTTPTSVCRDVHTGSLESPAWSELSYGTDKKKNATALNAVSTLNCILFSGGGMRVAEKRNTCGMSPVVSCSLSIFNPLHPPCLKFYLLSTWTVLNSMSHCASVFPFARQALKEIARVSEELCSYQDQIRKKSGDRR